MPVELGTGYVSLIPSAKGITAGIQRELGGPLTQAGKSAGADTSNAFASSFKKGLGGIQKSVLGTVGLAGIGIGLVKVGENFENAFNTIARGTGATGKQLDGLENSFRNVLKNGSGSFDQVSQAVTTLSTRTGLTGKALEDFAAKEVTLARITKTDIGANLQATTGLFNLYGVAVGQQSDKLDVLFKASQVAGVTITQLTSDMQTAAPTARVLGLSIDQTASLVANLDRAGVPASKVMVGLAGAFGKAAKAGKDPLAVINDLVDEIKAAPNPTAAATLAVQKFGISSRVASTLVVGLRDGTLNLTKSLDGGKGILDTAAATATLSGKFAHLKNVALVSLEPIATQALGAVTKGVELLTPAIDFLTGHMDVLGPIILGVAGAFATFKIAIGVQDIIVAGVEAISSLIDVLTVSTAAAGSEAAAMTGVAVATTEAAAASRSLALTPIGAAAAVAGVAIAVLVGKTSLLSHAQKDAGQATNDLVSSLLDEGKTLDQIAGKLVVKAIRDNKDLADALKATGISVNDVSDAISGNGKAYSDIQQKTKAYTDAVLANVKAQGVTHQGDLKNQNALSESAKLTGTVTDFVDKNRQSIESQTEAKKRAADASKDLAGKETDVKNAGLDAAKAQDQLRVSLDKLVTSSLTNADQLRGQKEGLLGVLQSAVQLQQSTADVAEKQKTLDDLRKNSKTPAADLTKATLDLEAAQLSLSVSTDTGVDSAEKFLADTVGLTGAQQKLADAQKNSKTTAGELAKDQDLVAQKQVAFKDALVHLAGRIQGPLHQALLDYAGQIKTLPTKTDFTALVHTQEAHDKVLKLHREYDLIPSSKTIKVDLDAADALHKLSLLDDAVRKINPNISIVAVNRANAQGRMAGGPVDAGQTYLVGEEGPEYVQFGHDGHVFPHGTSPSSFLTRRADDSRVHRAEPTRQAVFTGPIYAHDPIDLAKKIDDRMRRAEFLANA